MKRWRLYQYNYWILNECCLWWNIVSRLQQLCLENNVHWIQRCLWITSFRNIAATFLCLPYIKLCQGKKQATELIKKNKNDDVSIKQQYSLEYNTSRRSNEKYWLAAIKKLFSSNTRHFGSLIKECLSLRWTWWRKQEQGEEYCPPWAVYLTYLVWCLNLL